MSVCQLNHIARRGRSIYQRTARQGSEVLTPPGSPGSIADMRATGDLSDEDVNDDDCYYDCIQPWSQLVCCYCCSWHYYTMLHTVKQEYSHIRDLRGKAGSVSGAPSDRSVLMNSKQVSQNLSRQPSSSHVPLNRQQSGANRQQSGTLKLNRQQLSSNSNGNSQGGSDGNVSGTGRVVALQSLQSNRFSPRKHESTRSPVKSNI